MALVVLAGAGAPGSAGASTASLFLSPNTGKYAAGKTFTVGVYVSSPAESMNAASGTIDFPADILQVTGLSKSGSIVSLWVQEPSYSNVNGSINFEGLVLNPGFKGNSGKLLSITFRVKTANEAAV